ncbi:MAG TPA: hypothetical protein VJW77_12285, partial [Terriglobia bacterium]|nr:hypothetical protein [Terriglobia bacterium]
MRRGRGLGFLGTRLLARLKPRPPGMTPHPDAMRVHPYSSKPGAESTRNVINEVKPVLKSRQKNSKAIKQAKEETPRT